MRSTRPTRKPRRTAAVREAGRAARLLELTSALADVTTLEQVAKVLLVKGLCVVEATRGFVSRTDGSQLRVMAAHGYSDEQTARLMALTEDSAVPPADAARTRIPVWIESAKEYRERYRWAFDQFGTLSEAQAHVSVPLIHGVELVGILGMSFARPTAFGASDHAFTLLVAQAAAAAMYRARSYDEETERRRQAELVAAARADVLGVVAHDLRNPLHLIGMTAQLLLELEPPRDRQRQLLMGTQRAVNQMNRLVEDLLDAVRLQSGGLALKVETVDVRAVLQQADEVHRPLAAEKGVRLAIDAPPESVHARIDGYRILQALDNLIANAVKFTPPGGTVSLRVESQAADLTFRVSDTGAGIPPDAVDHVFDRFWQARKGDRRGVGLGLAIVKGIVDAHHGRVSVQSALGKGSTFVITLPRCAIEQ